MIAMVIRNGDAEAMVEESGMACLRALLFICEQSKLIGAKSNRLSAALPRA
jgi:hypothetical protein